jgi:hypothetical protein
MAQARQGRNYLLNIRSASHEVGGDGQNVESHVRQLRILTAFRKPVSDDIG